MSIIDQTLRQLIRNRIHEITDLAAEINEHTNRIVDVHQSGSSNGFEVAVCDPAKGIGVPDQHLGVALPGAGTHYQECIDIVDGLEDIAQQLRAIRHKGVPTCA